MTNLEIVILATNFFSRLRISLTLKAFAISAKPTLDSAMVSLVRATASDDNAMATLAREMASDVKEMATDAHEMTSDVHEMVFQPNN